MRKNLKIFRVQNDLSQQEMSERIGVTRATYSAVEKGIREGRRTFWSKLQQAFNIPDGEMWALQKDEK